MAFKNIVENQPVGCMKEATCLARTVNVAWTDLEPVKLENVWKHWRLALNLIIDDAGDNRLVETKRGKLFRAPPDEADIIEDVLDEEETELDLLKEAEIDDNY